MVSFYSKGKQKYLLKPDGQLKITAVFLILSYLILLYYLISTDVRIECPNIFFPKILLTFSLS